MTIRDEMWYCHVSAIFCSLLFRITEEGFSNYTQIKSLRVASNQGKREHERAMHIDRMKNRLTTQTCKMQFVVITISHVLANAGSRDIRGLMIIM